MVAVPTSHLATLHHEVSFAQGATLPVAGVTALRLLRIGGGLSGKRVLVTGAAGGVGRFAVELASQSGAEVTGVAASPQRAEGLEDLGAHAVVEDIEQAEGEFDLILEGVGGASLEASIRLVASRGTILIFGNSSNSPARVSFGDFRGHPGARIEAFFVYESVEPPTFGHDLQLLADMVAEGTLHPQIGMEMAWTEANPVFQAVANRQVNGKAVLLVG
jgi:NADPH:quinone reductase-like Zn-dependent oxidoreductase